MKSFIFKEEWGQPRRRTGEPPNEIFLKNMVKHCKKLCTIRTEVEIGGEVKTVTKTVHVLSLIYSRFLRLIEA